MRIPAYPKKLIKPLTLSVLIGLLSACAAGDPGATDGFSPSAAPKTATVPQVAFTTNTLPTYINTRYGPVAFGAEVGLPYTVNDFTVFDSHAVAAQALLSGSAEILGGSFITTALLREQGQNLKVFCSFNNSGTLALVGRNGVTSAEQLFDPNTRVAIDSPGGAGSLVFNALLESLNAPGTVDDIPNQQILESSSLRANAFAANQVDATVIHSYQYSSASAEVSDGVILATLADDVQDLVMQAFAAEESWLRDNKETAINFCATIIAGSRALKSDYSSFIQAVSAYIDEPPEESELREVFQIIERADVWPVGEISDDAFRYTLELGLRSGILASSLEVADVVDREILAQAVTKADNLR